VKLPIPQSVTWRVRVDAGLCIGSGICVGTAPKLFAFDDGQHSQSVSELVEAGEVVRDVAAACPVEAISITDAETGAPVSLG
jgi:ferredoxin